MYAHGFYMHTQYVCMCMGDTYAYNAYTQYVVCILYTHTYTHIYIYLYVYS